MDTLSKEERSKRMALVQSKGNKSTELALIRQFRKDRITGWRRNYHLHGNPDFVFPKKRVVVFVDGCFWHGCPKHLRLPKSNVDYWTKKIRKNASRDRQIGREMRRKGWSVVRVWEHDVRNGRASGILARTLEKASRRSSRRATVFIVKQ